jgi:hypothetical protein
MNPSGDRKPQAIACTISSQLPRHLSSFDIFERPAGCTKDLLGHGNYGKSSRMHHVQLNHRQSPGFCVLDESIRRQRFLRPETACDGYSYQMRYSFATFQSPPRVLYILGWERAMPIVPLPCSSTAPAHYAPRLCSLIVHDCCGSSHYWPVWLEA